MRKKNLRLFLVLLCLVCIWLISGRASIADSVFQDTTTPSATQSDPRVDGCFEIIEQVLNSFGLEGAHRSYDSSLRNPMNGVDYYCWILGSIMDANNNYLMGMNITITKLAPSPDSTCDMTSYLSTNPNITTTLSTFHDFPAVYGSYTTESNGETQDNQAISWCMYEQGSQYYFHVRDFSGSINKYGNAEDAIPAAEMLLSLMVFDEEQPAINDQPYADITLTPTPTLSSSQGENPVADGTISSQDSNDAESPDEGGSPDSTNLSTLLNSPAAKAIKVGLIVLAGLAVAAGLVVVLVKFVFRPRKLRTAEYTGKPAPYAVPPSTYSGKVPPATHSTQYPTTPPSMVNQQPPTPPTSQVLPLPTLPVSKKEAKTDGRKSHGAENLVNPPPPTAPVSGSTSETVIQDRKSSTPVPPSSPPPVFLPPPLKRKDQEKE